MKLIDLTGRRFGKLTVIERVENSNGGEPRWLTSCDCGGSAVVRGGNLRSGHTRSCGCITQWHGRTGSRVHNIWKAMIERCRNPKTIGWSNYGGRGIKVCERWHNFLNFIEDMGEPQDGMTLERLDNDGDYESGNCVWAPPGEQARNRRTNLRVDWNGESRIVADVADELGVSRSTVYTRISRGWGIETALTTPIRPYS